MSLFDRVLEEEARVGQARAQAWDRLPTRVRIAPFLASDREQQFLAALDAADISWKIWRGKWREQVLAGDAPLTPWTDHGEELRRIYLSLVTVPPDGPVEAIADTARRTAEELARAGEDVTQWAASQADRTGRVLRWTIAGGGAIALGLAVLWVVRK